MSAMMSLQMNPEATYTTTIKKKHKGPNIALSLKKGKGTYKLPRTRTGGKPRNSRRQKSIKLTSIEKKGLQNDSISEFHKERLEEENAIRSPKQQSFDDERTESADSDAKRFSQLDISSGFEEKQNRTSTPKKIINEKGVNVSNEDLSKPFVSSVDLSYPDLNNSKHSRSTSDEESSGEKRCTLHNSLQSSDDSYYTAVFVSYNLQRLFFICKNS